MKKSHLDSKYFTDELPLNFEANLGYVFSYKMSGQSGEKMLKFTTVKREEEIDEYELLFENEEKKERAGSLHSPSALVGFLMISFSLPYSATELYRL